MPGPNAASHRRASPAAAARGSSAPKPPGHHVDVAAQRYCPLIHVPVGRARTTRPSKPSISSTRECAAMTPADEPLPTESGTASAGSRRPISLAESGPSSSRSARISVEAAASHCSGRSMPPSASIVSAKRRWLRATSIVAAWWASRAASCPNTHSVRRIAWWRTRLRSS